MNRFIDLTGQKFGRLTVVERDCLATKKRGNHARWICRCDCGNYTVVASGNLKSGDTKSCGCLRREMVSKTQSKHRKTETKLFKIWCGMKQRCYSKNVDAYKDYGGRGISICDDWKDDFQAFYDWAMANGYSEGTSIDRIDNDNGYSPNNCRWTTRKVQQNNTRKNRYITYNGETHTLTEWSEISGIKIMTLWHRLDKGWSIEKALKTPVKR